MLMQNFHLFPDETNIKILLKFNIIKSHNLRTRTNLALFLFINNLSNKHTESVL